MLSHLEDARNRAFQKLRPFCTQLLVPSANHRDVLRDLRASVEAVIESPDGEETIAPLVDYIIFPLLHILKTSKLHKLAVIEAAVDVALAIFSHPTIGASVHLRGFVELFVLVSSLKQTEEQLLEKRIALLAALVALESVRDVSNEVEKEKQLVSVPVKSLLSKKQIFPVFAQGISVSLDLLTQNVGPHIKEGAIKLIGAITDKIDDPVLLHKIMPGIVSNLVKLVSVDHSETSVVLCVAIRVLGSLITSSFSNEVVNELTNKEEKDLPVSLEETGKKLMSSMKIVLSLRLHQSTRVRLEIANGTFRIIQSCHDSLKDLVPVLVETLALYLTDPFPQVSSAAGSFLSDFLVQKDDLQFINKQNLQKTLLEMTLLPQANDKKQLETLRIGSGYLVLLKESSRIPVTSCFDRAIHGIIKMITFELGDVRIVEDRRTQSVPDLAQTPLSNSIVTHKNFKFIKDDQVIQALVTFVRLLGFYGDLNETFSFLGDFIESEEKMSPEALWLVNELILGTRRESIDVPVEIQGSDRMDQVQSDVVLVVQRLLMFLDKPHSLSRDEEKDTTKEPSIARYHHNILITCMSLLCVCSSLQVLGKRFKEFLIDGLFVVLERIGDDNRHVREASLYVLDRIAASLEYSSTADIITQNFDYIANSVSIKFKNIKKYPKSPQILSASIKLANDRVLPFMADLVDDMLGIIDRFYTQDESLVLLICQALLEFVSVKGLMESVKTIKASIPVDRRTGPSEDLVSFEKFIRDQNELDVADEEMDPSTPQEDDYEVRLKEEEDKRERELKLSYHQETVFRIISRMEYFMSSDLARLRSKALGIIRMAVPVLQDKPRTLNPFIHQIWTVLVARIKDKVHFVQKEALDLLCTLAEYSNDFLTRKTIDDLLPIFSTVSVDLVKCDEYRIQGMKYKDTRHFQGHKAFILTLRKILERVPLRARDIRVVLDSIVPFLENEKFPEEVKGLAEDVFALCNQLEPDLTWLVQFTRGQISFLRKPSEFFRDPIVPFV